MVILIILYLVIADIILKCKFDILSQFFCLLRIENVTVPSWCSNILFYVNKNN